MIRLPVKFYVLETLWKSFPVLSKTESTQNNDVIQDFSENPILSVVGSLVNLAITVPVFITKFVEPAQMDATTFFNRWRALAKPEQESQSIFTASSYIGFMSYLERKF